MTIHVSLRPLGGGVEDQALCQQVFDSAPTYFTLVTGLPPARDAAARDLSELPPGCAPESRHIFAVLAGDEVVGVSDVLRGYPDPSAAFLGLLLIAENRQRLGLGSKAYRELEAVARGWEVARMRLAVVEANARAFGFWERQGFARTGETHPYHRGWVQSTAIVMQKRLSHFALG